MLKAGAYAISNLTGDYGAAAAGGAAAGAMIKSSGLPAHAKILAAGATAATVSGGVIVGKAVAESIKNNFNISEAIKEHKYAHTDIERVPSPDSTFINSVLEDSEQSIPLIDLLLNLVSINILELLLIIVLIFILFYKSINNFTINII